MNPIERVVAYLKSFRMAHPPAGGRVGWGPLSSVPFLSTTSGWDSGAVSVEPSQSAIVTATVLWLGRAFPEAPLRVQARDRRGQLTPVPDHPLTTLVATPNPFYSGVLLWQATIADWILSGNAYWGKVRAGAGNVRELWWLPARTVTPVGSDDPAGAFVDHYEYRSGGSSRPIAIDPGDVVHFRYGMDPQNPRLGLSPLAALLREIYVDEEAQRFTAAILGNLGVPGVVISPDNELSAEGAQQVKERFRDTFSGSRRGDVLVTRGKMGVSVLSFSPQQMNLRDLRRLPEERVTAVLGIPAIVVGLGAGLDRSCVPADARVQTPYGTRTIAELEAGAIVWSFKDGRIEPRRVEHKWPARRDVVYDVRTPNRRLRLTGNHPLMVRVPGHSRGANTDRHAVYEWRRTDALAPGDRIIFAKAYPDQGGTTLPDGREATPGMLQFLGAVIGDGTVRPGVGVRLAMPPADRCVGHYETLASALFTRQASHSGGAVGVQETLERAPIFIQRRERDFGFSSAQASRTLAVWGVSGRAHTKRVPTWVYALARPLRLAFLAGIVDTDGYVDRRGALTVTFCNRALVEDVRDLAIGLGIRCSNVGHRRIPAARLPNAGTRLEYEAWTFTASSARQVAEIPFVDPLYRERVMSNPDRHRGEGFDAPNAGLSHELGFTVIRSIRSLGEMDVYDLTVEDGHSFFCENVLVSNTFANFEEARQAAYESNVIPTQRLLGAEIQTQLLPDFGDPKQLQVDFDLGQVRVLQPDQDALWARLNIGVAGGWVQVNEARAQVGLEPLPDGDVVYVAANLIPTDPAALLPPEPAAVPVGAPTPLRALPPPEEQAPEQASFEDREEKAADPARYAGGIARVRARHEPTVEREVARVLKRQQAAVIAAIESQSKAIGWGDVFDLAGATQAMRRVLERAYRRILDDVVPLTEATLGVPAAPDARSVLDYLAECGKQIGGISETTRAAIAGALQESVRLGEGVPEMAQRIRALTAFDRPRAVTISRTETATASNNAAMSSFHASGIVVGVTVLDGDDCGLHSHDGLPKANGMRFRLDEMGDIPMIAHPRCVRAVSPIVDASELEGAA